MLVGQLAGRDSLRGIVDAFSPQSRKLYHLGLGSFSRSSLARANEKTPAELFEKVFVALLARCQSLAPPNQKFRFKDGGKVYLLDATVIELPLSLFRWATYRASKGALIRLVISPTIMPGTGPQSAPAIIVPIASRKTGSFRRRRFVAGTVLRGRFPRGQGRF